MVGKTQKVLIVRVDDLRVALSGLSELARKYPNQLHVAEYATHEKMLVVDSEVVVFGSANWLSNRQYKNSERCIVVMDKAIASSEEKRISTLVNDKQGNWMNVMGS